MDLEEMAIQSVKDVQQKASPVYYNEQIDQMIITPDSRSNLLTKKRPKMVKKPIFAVDENGGRVPVLNDEGEPVLDSSGIAKYVIDGYEDVQEGWQAELEVIPSPEIFTVDNATSNISQAAVNFNTRTYWFYDFLQVYQHMTKLDYSIYLHKLKNDAHSVLHAGKSYNGGTVQAIKTFINKTDSKQWMNKEEEEKKAGLNPLSWITGGQKKRKPEPEQKFTSFA